MSPSQQTMVTLSERRTLSIEGADSAAEIDDSDKLLWHGADGGEVFDAGITATRDKLGVGRTPEGSSFPAAPKVGDRFILLSPENVAVDHVLPAHQAQTTLRQIILGGGAGYPVNVSAYSPTYSGNNHAALRNKVFVVYGGARQKTASRLYLYGDKLGSQSHTVSASAVAGLPHGYEVTGLTYDDLTPGNYYVNVEYTDGSKLYPDRQFTLGDYSYAGGATGWELTPGVAAAWATQGQPEPRTLLAVTQLMDGAAVGITVGNSGQIQRNSLTGFTPAFDLDDADHQAGILQVEATLRFSTRGATTIGFDQDSVNPLTEARITGFAFVSAVRASTTYAGSADNGIEIGEATIYNGAATLGVVKLLLAKDGNNVLGYYLSYAPLSGSVNFALSMTMEAAFIHNDAPAPTPPMTTSLGPLLATSHDLPTSGTGRFFTVRGNWSFPNSTYRQTLGGSGEWGLAPHRPDDKAMGVWATTERRVGADWIEQGAMMIPWGEFTTAQWGASVYKDYPVTLNKETSPGRNDAVTGIIRHSIYTPNGFYLFDLLRYGSQNPRSGTRVQFNLAGAY